MRTVHFALRVADLERSLAFYRAVGYEVVGEVPDSGIGHLTMLKLPDDEFVTVELVHRPTTGDGDPGAGLSHFVIAVESMHGTVAALTGHGIDVGAPTSPDGTESFLTAWATDPDGNRVELVQWPTGHPAGMTAADFAD